MANKVYLLIDGPRDDRRILAAFSKREAAEAALSLGDGDVVLTDLVVDGPLRKGPPGHSIWCVQDYKGYFAVRLSGYHDYAMDQVVVEDGCYEVNVWALDEDHALRLGRERIEQFKSQAGLPGLSSGS